MIMYTRHKDECCMPWFEPRGLAGGAFLPWPFSSSRGEKHGPEVGTRPPPFAVRATVTRLHPSCTLTAQHIGDPVRPPHAQASPWAYLLTSNAAAAAAISTSAPSSAPASTSHLCSFLPSYSLPLGLGKKASMRPKRFAMGPLPRTAKATTLTVRCPSAPVDPRTQHPHPRPCLARRLQLVSRLRYLHQRLGRGGVGRGRG